MCNNDLVNDDVFAIDGDRKVYCQRVVEKNAATASHVCFGAVRSPYLIIDRRPLPSLPVDHWVFVGIIEVPAFAIEKYENMIFKNGEKVAKFLAIVFERVGVTPQFQEGLLAKIGEQPFGRSDAGGFNDTHCFLPAERGGRKSQSKEPRLGHRGSAL